jgi:hypothetical protein
VDAELHQSPCHVLAGGRRLHLAIDEQDAAVPADVEGVPGRESESENAIGAGRLFRRIAQDRIIESQRLGESAVLLGPIDAGGDVGDLEFPDLVSALPERLAFGGSSSRECPGEPGKNDGALTLELGQAMDSSVRAGKREARSRVSDIQSFEDCRSHLDSYFTNFGASPLDQGS